MAKQEKLEFLKAKERELEDKMFLLDWDDVDADPEEQYREEIDEEIGEGLFGHTPAEIYEKLSPRAYYKGLEDFKNRAIQNTDEYQSFENELYEVSCEIEKIETGE